MSETTGISWADHTWNPWIGCFKISPGCRNCYAETLIAGTGPRQLGRPEAWGKNGTRTKTTTWPQVRTWNRKAIADGVRRRVFPSLCDPFEGRDAAQGAVLSEAFDLMRECPGLDFLLLTKRPDNIPRLLPADWGPKGWPNVWLGVSVESGEDSCVCGHSRRPVRDRVAELARIPAVVRFVSYEPAIGPPLRLGGAWDEMDWIIYGGESGARRRPEGEPNDPKSWARTLRGYCSRAGIAYWHKQSSAFRPGQGVELDGAIVQQLPIPRASAVTIAAPGGQGLLDLAAPGRHETNRPQG